MQNTLQTADAAYYNELRPTLLKLVRGRPGRVFELGCAAGKTLGHFKAQGATFVAGLELVPEVAERARARGDVDWLEVGDIESRTIDLPDESFDLVIASHVLEHVRDPWSVLKRLVRLLRPGGQLVGSLPNVRCFRVTVPLVLLGQWKYTSHGILDWTHFRFFTRQAIRELLLDAALGVDVIEGEVTRAGKLRLIDTLSLGLLRDFCAFTFNFSATKPGPSPRS